MPTIGGGPFSSPCRNTYISEGEGGERDVVFASRKSMHIQIGEENIGETSREGHSPKKKKLEEGTMVPRKAWCDVFYEK